MLVPSDPAQRIFPVFPNEVTRTILRYALYHQEPLTFDPRPNFHFSPNVLATNRRVRDIGTDILYHENTLTITVDAFRAEPIALGISFHEFLKIHRSLKPTSRGFYKIQALGRFDSLLIKVSNRRSEVDDAYALMVVQELCLSLNVIDKKPFKDLTVDFGNHSTPLSDTDLYPISYLRCQRVHIRPRIDIALQQQLESQVARAERSPDIPFKTLIFLDWLSFFDDGGDEDERFFCYDVRSPASTVEEFEIRYGGKPYARPPPLPTEEPNSKRRRLRSPVRLSDLRDQMFEALQKENDAAFEDAKKSYQVRVMALLIDRCKDTRPPLTKS